MRIAAYVQPRRTIGLISGVGKHVANAPLALAANHHVQLLAARDQLEPDGAMLGASLLTKLPHHCLPWSARTIEWGGALFGRPRLNRWLRKCDCLYCPAETLPAVDGVPRAVTIHTSDWAELDLPWSRELRYRKLRARWQLWIRAVRKANVQVLAVSEFLRDRLINLLKLKPTNIHVVGNGVEPAFYETGNFKVPNNLIIRKPYVAVVGGLSIYKGGDRAIAVARLLPDYQFLVIGSAFGPKVDLPSNVTCIDYLSVDDGLPWVLAGAVALLHLSRYETFGIPVAEAMAVGVVPIAGATGALPEVLGDAGLVVDADCPPAVADSIRMLASEHQQRETLIKRGKDRAEFFRWERVAVRIQNALQSMKAC